jgi:catechol 2,3-dioxygenase
MIEAVISEIGHVAIRVTDLEEAVFTATRIMGLRQSHRDGDTVYLTHGAPHHSLMYIASDVNAVDHLGFVARDDRALEEVRSRVEARGLEVVSDAPLDALGIRRGFAFIGAEGFTYEIYTGMSSEEPDYVPSGTRPNRFGHINLYASDLGAAESFFTELMDFRVSDYLGERDGVFLRCNVDHHAVALLPGAGVLHHHAWEVQSIADIARLGDHLDTLGQAFLWGPVRHGIGRNIAGYFREPAGTVVEFYADMERIYDDSDFVPRTWDPTGTRWFSFWAPMRNPEFRGYGLPPYARTAGAVA